MCPICWATALASFSGLLAISLLVVAGSDYWMLTLSALTAGLAVWHRWIEAAIPWWGFCVLFVALGIRLVYLMVAKRDELLISRVWTRARRFSARRCPNR